MTDELDERFLDEETQSALWSQEVYEGERGEEEADDEAGDKLNRPVTSSPAWEAIVPQCGQQLLTVGLSYKLSEQKHKYMTIYISAK